MGLAIRPRLGLATALAVLAATSTSVHVKPLAFLPLDDVITPEPDPFCSRCPVVDQPASETAPWNESTTIPTARFEARDGPLTLTVEVRPPSPLAGEAVRVRVVVTTLRPGLLSVGLAFGEERPDVDPRVVLECKPTQPPPTRVIQRKTLVREVRFNAAGDHRVRGAAQVHRCNDSEDVDGGGMVPVRPSRLATNGPQAPRIAVTSVERWEEISHERGVTIAVRGEDADGYVRRLDIDWGDGSAAETVGVEPESCGTSPILVPSAPAPRWRTHIYTRDGTYRVTATATSAGCDGRFRQVARAHYAVTVPRS